MGDLSQEECESEGERLEIACDDDGAAEFALGCGAPLSRFDVRREMDEDQSVRARAASFGARLDGAAVAVKHRIERSRLVDKN